MLETSEKIPVGVVGANGYAGRELARLLLNHPYANLVACFGRNAEWTLDEELNDVRAAQVPTLKIESLKSDLRKFKSVFLATPHEISMELAPGIIGAGVQVIDLSGAFRNEASHFERWYGLSHSSADLLSQAQYGLVPWNIPQNGSSNKKSGSALLISNPGCYATSVLMALIPLLRSKIIDPQNIVVDAKSGTSGAGRKAKENLLFNEVDGECSPYRVGKHQHIPEITRYVKKFSGVEIQPHFVTSMIPVKRGIISAIYSKPGSDLNEISADGVLDLIDSAFESAYKDYPLVRYGRLGVSDKGDRALLSLKRVVGSCRTHISYTVVDHKIYIFSTIDNLLKGAASQAIENWNVAHGYAEDAGLTAIEGIL